MAREQPVETSIWTRDEDFADLAPHAKVVALWSITNPQTNSAGVMPVSQRAIASDTGLDRREVADALSALEGIGFAYYEEGVLWIRTRARRVLARAKKNAPNMVKAILGDLDTVRPGHPIRQRFAEYYGGDSDLSPHLLPPDTPAGGGRGVPTVPVSPIVEPNPGTPEGRGGGTSGEVQQPTPHQQQTSTSDLSQLVDEILAKLAECDRWTVNPVETRVQVENAIASFPDADHMQAARDAVIWGMRGNYKSRNAGTGYLTALQKQEKPGAAKPERPSATEWDALADELEAQEREAAA